MRAALDRNRMTYYGLGLVFILPIILLFAIVGVATLNILFLVSSYLWNFTALTPGVPERVRARRYRLSFLKIIYKYHQALEVRLYRHPKKKFIIPGARALFPFLLFSVLSYFTGGGNPFYALLGALYFELGLFLLKKLKVVRL